MEKLVYLRPAKKEDLFDDQELKDNAIFFERSKISGNFCGPHEICQSNYIGEIITKLYMATPMIYVLTHEPGIDTITFFLNLRTAVAEDFTLPHSKLKLNTSYWFQHEKEFMGPFKPYEAMDKHEFHRNIKAGNIFILTRSENQQFIPINPVRHAS